MRRALVVTIGCVFLAAGCGGESAPEAAGAAQSAALTDEQLAAVRVQVVSFCGDCHATPEPREFPRRAWMAEVQRGYALYHASGRTDLEKPVFADILKYYRQLAPDNAAFYADLDQARSLFRAVRPLARPQAAGPGASPSHGVSNVLWDPDAHDGAGRILYCDLVSGEVCSIDPRRPESTPVVLARVKAAAHVERCDLDRDGLGDYLVSDIGEARGLDVFVGAVVWLRNTGRPDEYDSITLQDGLARTCDARAGDFDGDGDEDVIVAEFGYLETGRILLLEQVSLDPVEFRLHEVDGRHGVINTIPTDLDGDGDLDVIALVSQEHETVDAFVNRGDGSFDRHVLFQATTPTYGSSGIELVDLDRDGDTDILYTNGDSFDGPIPKLLHSVQWLEREGPLSYVHRHIAYMPGVHRAVPLDLDGDGDIDLAAVSLLPPLEELDTTQVELDSVTCFINRGDQRFDRRSLEARNFAHPSCVVGDFDGDGDPDLAVGNVSLNSRRGAMRPVDIWENREPEDGLP